MQYFQRIESGLPIKDFVLAGGDRGQSAARPVGEGRRISRLPTESPWRANREAGERLTWRGRNFIEAFVEINHCELARATMFDLRAGQGLLSPVAGAPAGEQIEHYHFVCRASDGSRMQVGDTVVELRAGDLWRVYASSLPRTVHGGCQGGVHLELQLSRRDAGWRAGMIAEGQNFWDHENNSGAAA